MKQPKAILHICTVSALVLVSHATCAREVAYDFYGIDISVTYHFRGNLDSLEHYSRQPPTAEMFDRFCGELENSDYRRLARQMKRLKKRYGLDGWGYYMLTHKFVEAAYPGQNRLFRQLLLHFLLIRQKYIVQLFYDSENVEFKGNLNMTTSLNCIFYGYRGMASSMSVGGKPCDRVGDKPCDVVEGKLYMYGVRHRLKGAKKFIVEYGLPPFLYEQADTVMRNISFGYKGEPYAFALVGNRHLLEYLDDMPSFMYHYLYVSFGLSNQLENSFVKEVEKVLQPLGKVEKINFLLALCQSLPYKTDEENMGYGRHYFPEQTLLHKYSDCEDRSMLFALLLKRLLGEKSWLLVYRNHVNIGIDVDMGVWRGNVATFGENEYNLTVCDPTIVDSKPGDYPATYLRGISPETYIWVVIPLYMGEALLLLGLGG